MTQEIQQTQQIKNSHLIRPFQKEAVEWIEEKNGNGLVAIPMGGGKCLISLLYIAKHNLKTLVICPNSIKLTWSDEITKWIDKTCSVINAKDKELDFSKDITIINYDIVKKYLSELQAQDFDCIVLDESVFIKSTKSQRSKAVKRLNIPKKILLSGTPITNSPMDIWNQLNYLDPLTWNNWLHFRNQYITGYTHPRFHYFVTTGTRNIGELSEKIKPFVHRKRKEEILQDLPAKIYNKILINVDGEYAKQYDLAMKSFKDFLSEYTELTKVEIRKRLRGEAFTKVQLLKQICSEYKVQGNVIKSVVENIFENNPDDKIVIFSQYRKTVEDLRKQLKGSVTLHGGMDTDKRKESVDALQNDPKTKIFIATIQAGGMGLTLTRASHVIFVDLPWSPAEKEQAEDRCHRLGTHKPVNIFYIMCQKTIDEVIYGLLSKKQSTIDQIIDGQEYKKPINIFNKFVEGEMEKL